MKHIRITTAPTATAATTAARLAARFPAFATLDDGLRATLIAEATEAAEAYLGRPLARATYTELLSGTGGEILRLGRAPLESITSITLDGTLLDAATYDRVDEKQPNVRRLAAGSSSASYDTWPIARQGVGRVESLAVAGLRELLNVQVVYVAGYWLPSMAGTAPAGAHTIGVGLEGAIQRAIFDKHQREALPVGVSSVKKGDREIRYAELPGYGMVSADVMTVLDREKVVYE